MEGNTPSGAAQTSPILSNSAYDKLKFVVTILLPGLGTLYFALAQIWGFPNPEGVVGTIVALTAFLGLFLKASTVSYENSGAKYDGTITVTENADGVKQAALQLHNYENPADVVNQKEVTFKVTP